MTEDADIGIRLSTLGETIRVVYEAEYATREETPNTMSSFIRQRTRWNQGFLQVMLKGDWRRMPRLKQRLLAIFTFGHPFLQALLTFLLPMGVWFMFVEKLPVLTVIISYLPLYALGFQFLAYCVGLFIFLQEFGMSVPVLQLFFMALEFFPFQWLLGFSAIRAVFRQLRRENSWEKTVHLGAHRQGQKVLSPVAKKRFASLLAFIMSIAGINVFKN